MLTMRTFAKLDAWLAGLVARLLTLTMGAILPARFLARRAGACMAQAFAGMSTLELAAACDGACISMLPVSFAVPALE